MKHWYVVQTKPRKEREAEENLQRQGFHTYLPWLQGGWRRGSDWNKVIEPLFPRYLFIYVDMHKESVAPIRSTRGVTQLIKFGQHIQPVDPGVIDYLKLREDLESGCYIAQEKSFAKGDKMEIREGPFEGLVGIYEKTSGEGRVVVLLSYLGGQNRVTLPGQQIGRP